MGLELDLSDHRGHGQYSCHIIVTHIHVTVTQESDWEAWEALERGLSLGKGQGQGCSCAMWCHSAN